MPIKLKYSDIHNFQFAQAVQKIASTPADTNSNACRIRRTVRELTETRQKIKAEYEKDIMEKFALRDEKGEKVKPAEAEEAGPDGFNPDPAKSEELLKAQEEFGKRIAEIECFPLTLSTVTHVKLSAQEIEALKELFDDSEEESNKAAGPGLPQNVKSLR